MEETIEKSENELCFNAYTSPKKTYETILKVAKTVYQLPIINDGFKQKVFETIVEICFRSR
jgi:hypothetical protein